MVRRREKEEEVYGNSLYFLLNFSVNLKFCPGDSPGGPPSGGESVFQCRGQGMDLWSGN